MGGAPGENYIKIIGCSNGALHQTKTHWNRYRPIAIICGHRKLEDNSVHLKESGVRSLVCNFSVANRRKMTTSYNKLYPRFQFFRRQKITISKQNNKGHLLQGHKDLNAKAVLTLVCSLQVFELWFCVFVSLSLFIAQNIELQCIATL